MPVTQTAKRALRSSKRKALVNSKIRTDLEVALRRVKKSGSADDLKKATSAADRAAKKGLIHKNKAARIKSKISSYAPKSKAAKTVKK